MSSPQAKSFDWKNLGIRVASATVLVPLALGAVWIGGAAFLVMIAAGVALLAFEWAVMSAPVSRGRVAWLVALPVLFAVFLAYHSHGKAALMAMAGGMVVAGMTARPLGARAWDLAPGVFYLAAPAISLIWLRSGPGGMKWTIMLLGTVWIADIGAFTVGNMLKGPKLWPRFSPNKTWSGFFGGIAFGALAALLIARGFDIRLTLLQALAGGAAAALSTMAGDLLESAVKRQFGVKDSGDLIPGHGGLLDRVDGLLVAAVVVAIWRWLTDRGLAI
jgi:phosphatidate cytidylyltransferase